MKLRFNKLLILSLVFVVPALCAAQQGKPESKSHGDVSSASMPRAHYQSLNFKPLDVRDRETSQTNDAKKFALAHQAAEDEVRKSKQVMKEIRARFLESIKSSCTSPLNVPVSKLFRGQLAQAAI